MSTSQVFESEALLDPINDDDPAGKRPSILENDKLKEYREDFDPERDLSEEDRRNPAMMEKPKVVPQWDKIIQFSHQYFQKTGKDLVVAVRTVEALTRRHGFAGLRDGIRFLRRLCEDCWDRMHPMMDDPSDPDEIEGRCAPFVFIDDEVNQPRFPNTVRSIPLLTTSDGVPVTYANCQSYDSGTPAVVSPDEFRAAAMSAPSTVIDQVRIIDEDITEALDELKGLVAVLDEKAGSIAPGLSSLKKAIEDSQSMAREILRLRGGGAGSTSANSTESSESDDDGSQPQRSHGGGMSLGSVGSREDVYARLNELTLLLEQFDPHSPVPFLIRRAIEMRDLRFPELVDTLTSSRPVLDFIRAPITNETTSDES